MNENNNVSIGVCLRELRESRGESLRVVAASVDIDPTLLSKIERDCRLPTHQQISELAAYFGVSDDELQARRIASDFLCRHGNGPAVKLAVALISENLFESNSILDRRIGSKK